VGRGPIIFETAINFFKNFTTGLQSSVIYFSGLGRGAHVVAQGPHGTYEKILIFKNIFKI